MSAATTSPAKSWHRPDITGLRSLAIVPVVAFHAGITAIPGGFVGVDVFYVISGFLITTLLVREASERRLHLSQFWARRLRRLVPASVAMVAVTLVAGLIILSPLRWAKLGEESLASLFYVSNFLFAGAKTDYFAADLAIPSPLIHTWSLGVEEQFYLFWPLLILLVAFLARKARIGIRIPLFVVFGILAVASFALSYLWSRTMPEVAFYLLPTRVWEFALAGLLALVHPFVPLPRWLRSIAGIVGIAALVVALFIIDAQTEYPGRAALIPVAGTLLLIIAGPRTSDELPSLPSRLLTTKPFVWLGDISYSWYLWHWPFIVLVPIALNNDSLLVTLLAGLASLGAAVLSYRFLENPVRFHPRLMKSVSLTIVVCVVALLPVSAAAAAAIGIGNNSGHPTVDGVQLDLNEARFPTNLDPCDRVSTLASGDKICESGDLDSDTIVLFAGDSHAGQWRAAMSEAAKLEHVRLVVRWKPACPVVPVNAADADGKFRAARGCKGFLNQTIELAKQLQPAAIVVSQTDGYYKRIVGQDKGVLSEKAQLDEWTLQYNNLIDRVSPFVGEFAVIVDNPRIDFDPSDCLARFGATAEGCSVPREEALDDVAPLHNATDAVLSARDITATLNTTDLVCDESRCQVVGNGYPIFRDYNHLAREWTLTQVPAVREFLREAITH